MSRIYARGLVVGKFCPLHLGHQYLIEHALRNCEQVFIISYSKPEFVDYEANVREAWLQTLYPNANILVVDDARLVQLCQSNGIDAIPRVPHNDAPDDAHRQFVAWLCTNILHTQVDIVFTSEAYGDGFAHMLSQCFAADVVHVNVDQARQHIPVSGTAIRHDVHANRMFLAPQVYAHFVKKICLLGGESSGKTTLAQALAARLDTVWVAEYGRELWLEKEGLLEFEDMYKIASTQLAHEQMRILHANTWLVCDTSPLTTLFYSFDLFGTADSRLKELAQTTYRKIFVCAPDFPFVQDGTRRDETFRLRQHAWYIEHLTRSDSKFFVLNGTIENRIQQVVDSL